MNSKDNIKQQKSQAQPTKVRGGNIPNLEEIAQQFAEQAVKNLNEKTREQPTKVRGAIIPNLDEIADQIAAQAVKNLNEKTQYISPITGRPLMDPQESKILGEQLAQELVQNLREKTRDK